MSTLPCEKITRGQQRLTPAQEAYARQFAQERIAAMLSTTPIDEEKAEEHLRQVYRVAGLELPVVRWFDSPAAFIQASISSIGDRKSMWAGMGNDMWDSVSYGVRSSVRESVKKRVWEGVKNSVENSVRESILASVRGDVRNNVRESVLANVSSGVESSVRESIKNSVWGSVKNSVRNSVRRDILMSLRFDEYGVGDNVRDDVRESILARESYGLEESVRSGVKDGVRKENIPNGMWFGVRGGMGESVLASVWSNVKSSVKESILAGVCSGVEDSVREESIGSILASVWSDVKGSRRESILTSVWSGVEEDVEESILASVWSDVEENVRDSILAYYNEEELACDRFFHEVFKENPLIHLAYFNEMVSGYRLGSKAVWLVHKPVHLQRDARGRLHSEDGMCMQYRDGWGFYAWHGVHVSEDIILYPEYLIKQDWLAERNMEVRRAIQERLGNERFVQLVGGVCIDTGARGTLIQIGLGNDPERVAHYVKVKDASTPREYYLRVPPSITRADEAVAWTFGLESHTYQPTQET